jgi:hypothetical protein
MLVPSQLLLWILLLCLLAWTATFIWLAFRRSPEARLEINEMTIAETPLETEPLANLAGISSLSPAIEIATPDVRNLVEAAAE